MNTEGRWICRISVSYEADTRQYAKPARVQALQGQASLLRACGE